MHEFLKSIFLKQNVKTHQYECIHQYKGERRRYMTGPKKGNIVLQPERVIGTNYYEFKNCEKCALEAKQALNRNDLFLYTRDNFGKNYVLATQSAIYIESRKKNPHFYENYDINDQLKLMVDIDIDIARNEKCTSFKLSKIIKKGKNYLINILKNYTNVKPELIFLNSTRNWIGEHKGKYSIHIICRNIFLNSFKHIEFLLKSGGNYREANIDFSIYRKGSLRMLYNTKQNIPAPLEFIYGYNYKKPNEEQLFIDCLLNNIPKDATFIDIKLPINKIKPIKQKVIKVNNAIIEDNENIKAEYSIEEIKKVLILLSDKRADSYNDWRNVGMALYASNSSLQCCKLWHNFSKRRKGKVATFEECKEKWYTFRAERCYNFASLERWVRYDNPDIYYDRNTIEKANYDSIKIEREYLLDRDENIKDCKTDFTKLLYDIFKNKESSDIIAIKSPYDTGKTTILKKIFDEFDPESVLMPTYRCSLGNDLYGNFKDYGFDFYQDGFFNSEKLIVQLESLHKVIYNYNDVTNENKIICEIPSYDCVVIDEIEGLLNQFESKTMKNASETFSILKGIIHNSKKIILLDGDFHNRSYYFMSLFKKNKTIIENTIMKCKDRYVFMNQIDEFEEKLDKDIKEDKNIVLISMSAKLAEFYKTKYKEYDPIVHTARSGKKNNIILKDVTKHWSQCSLLIYSPTVEAGISFDVVNHFDKRYVILANDSCSQRSLLQMINRVRKVNDSEINVFMNGLKYYNNAVYNTYKQTKKEIHDICKTRFQNITTDIDPNTGKYIVKYKYQEDDYINLQAYNKQEIFNKRQYCFVALFLELIRKKGCKFVLPIEKIGTRKMAPDIYIKKIANANMITEEQAEKMNKLKMEYQLTEKNSYALDKYNLQQFWYKYENYRSEDEFMFIDDDDEDKMTFKFLKDHYGKEINMYNLRLLLGWEEIDDFKYNKILQRYDIAVNKSRKKDQIDAVEKLILKFGFDKDELGSDNYLTRIQFLRKVIKYKDNYDLFRGVNDGIKKFETDKEGFDIIKPFMGYINKILKIFGLKIVSLKVGKKKVPIYYLDIQDIFKKFNEFQ